MERPACPKCKIESPNKNGQHLGKQRWKCKACRFEFTRSEPKGKPYWMKELALRLYQNRMSLNGIAKLLGVSTPSVLSWVRLLAKQVIEKPEPEQVRIIELDEVWHFIDKKSENVGSGWLLIAINSESLTGKSAIEVQLP